VSDFKVGTLAASEHALMAIAGHVSRKMITRTSA